MHSVLKFEFMIIQLQISVLFSRKRDGSIVGFYLIFFTVPDLSYGEKWEREESHIPFFVSFLPIFMEKPLFDHGSQAVPFEKYCLQLSFRGFEEWLPLFWMCVCGLIFFSPSSLTLLMVGYESTWSVLSISLWCSSDVAMAAPENQKFSKLFALLMW